MVRWLRHRDRDQAVSVEVVVPWRETPERIRQWAYVRMALQTAYPAWPIRLGSCRDNEPFNRSAAIVSAALASDATTLVIHDSDVIFTGPLGESVDYVEMSQHWAVPHTHLRRLTEGATESVLDGSVALGPALALEEPKYVGNPTGPLVVMPREMRLDVPPDVRFKGWGQEDEAWGAALVRLVGRPWRGPHTLYHLWHPPAERRDRMVGSDASEDLRAAYDRCSRSVLAMRGLVDRSKVLWPDELGRAQVDGVHPVPTDDLYP